MFAEWDMDVDGGTGCHVSGFSWQADEQGNGTKQEDPHGVAKTKAVCENADEQWE